MFSDIQHHKRYLHPTGLKAHDIFQIGNVDISSAVAISKFTVSYRMEMRSRSKTKLSDDSLDFFREGFFTSKRWLQSYQANTAINGRLSDLFSGWCRPHNIIRCIGINPTQQHTIFFPQRQRRSFCISRHIQINGILQN